MSIHILTVFLVLNVGLIWRTDGLSYKCSSNKISMIDFGNERVTDFKVYGNKSCAMTTNVTLVKCLSDWIHNDVKLYKTHKPQETDSIMRGRNNWKAYHLTCTEQVSKENVELKPALQISEPSATDVPVLHEHYPSLTANKTTDIAIGEGITLTLAIEGNYKLNPLQCKAYSAAKDHRNQQPGVEIWSSCKTPEPDIINVKSWNSDTDQKQLTMVMYAFKFNDNTDDVFIECDTNVCPSTPPDSPECTIVSCTKRKRRSINDYPESPSAITRRPAKLHLKVIDNNRSMNSAPGISSHTTAAFGFLYIAYQLLC